MSWEALYGLGGLLLIALLALAAGFDRGVRRERRRQRELAMIVQRQRLGGAR